MAAESTKCACADCKCTVAAGQGVTKDGKSFCCEACANGHVSHQGCEHDGCNCHG